MGECELPKAAGVQLSARAVSGRAAPSLNLGRVPPPRCVLHAQSNPWRVLPVYQSIVIVRLYDVSIQVARYKCSLKACGAADEKLDYLICNLI